MKREEIYQKTCDILFAAYFNGSLQHNNCWACATGNIIAANMDLKIEIDPTTNKGIWLNRDNDQVPSQWSGVFCTSFRKKHFLAKSKPVQYVNFDNYIGDAALQIKSTGYTPLELSKIELAFEAANYGKTEEDYMYNGLVAVLDTLKEIHEVENNSNEIKRFNRHYLSL